MTWQDELQHLDAELAAGRVSAEEYRSRRDALLGRAERHESSRSAAPSGPNPQQAQRKDPFPPPFTWGDTKKQGGERESHAPDGSDDPTQLMANPLLGQHGVSDSETTTQVVGIPHAGPRPWPHSQPPWQHGWAAPDSSGTPWDGTDWKPAATTWAHQGPEVFDTARKKSGKGKLIAGVSIAAAIVIALVCGGVFYVTSEHDDATQVQPGQQQSAPRPLPDPPAAKATPPATSQEVLITVPGPPHPFDGPLDPAAVQGPKSGLLQQDIRDFALRSGLVDGWFNGTTGTPRTAVIALRMPDHNTAEAVTRRYLDSQDGLDTVDALSYKGVQVVSAASTFRTAYVTNQWAVIVDVTGSDKQSTQDLFTSILGQQLNQSPPTVR